MNPTWEMTVEMAREIIDRDANTWFAARARKRAQERQEAIRAAIVAIENIRSWPLGSYPWCADASAVKAEERKVADALRERWGNSAVDELRAAVYATAKANT